MFVSYTDAIVVAAIIVFLLVAAAHTRHKAASDFAIWTLRRKLYATETEYRVGIETLFGTYRFDSAHEKWQDALARAEELQGKLHWYQYVQLSENHTVSREYYDQLFGR